MYAHVRRVSADLRASRDALNAPVVVSFNVSPIPFCRFFFFFLSNSIAYYIVHCVSLRSEKARINPIPRVSFFFIFLSWTLFIETFRAIRVAISIKKHRRLIVAVIPLSN